MELLTLARPYAKAAFECAMANHQCVEWSQVLSDASKIAVDVQMQDLFSHPEISTEQTLNIFLELLNKESEPEFNNFLRILAEYRRLTILPEIYKAFEALNAEYHKVKQVDVISAYELTDSEEAQLITALEKRLNCKVELHCEVDSSILGGAIVRVGDLVIDGSGRTRLTRLTQFLEGTAL